jgi:hypothetical protein
MTCPWKPADCGMVYLDIPPGPDGVKVQQQRVILPEHMYNCASEVIHEDDGTMRCAISIGVRYEGATIACGTVLDLPTVKGLRATLDQFVAEQEQRLRYKPKPD